RVIDGRALAVDHALCTAQGRRDWGMRRTTVFVAASMALIAVVAVTPAHAASTRQEYAAQADPYCSAEGKDTERLWRRFVQANSHFKFHAAGTALYAVGSRIEQTNNQLRLISAPPGDETLIGDWLGLWDRVAQKWKLAASAYRLGKYHLLNRLLNDTGH